MASSGLEQVSVSTNAWGFGDDQIGKSFPIHHEIALPFSAVRMDAETVSDFRYISSSCHSQSLPSEVSFDNLGFHEDEDRRTVTSNSPSLALTNTSLLTDGTHTFPVQILGITTRQSTMEIGEEWENFHDKHKASSCPPSLINGRRGKANGLCITTQPYSASEPGADVEKNSDINDNRANEAKIRDPFPLHYFFTEPSSAVKDCQIYPNPFNKINHKFHSTLQCPCFLYFFFICCLPGLHFMHRSDRKFKRGDKEKARKLGLISTILYTIGSIVGVVFFSVAVFFAAQYVRQYVSS